jgi:hypothetical protein
VTIVVERDAESMTNEATDARELATNEPTIAADVGLESPTYIRALEQNATNEPTIAALGDGGRGAEMTAGTNDGDDSNFHDEIDRQKSVEWIRSWLARMAAIRAEKLWELNEKIRREAQEANAGRRPRPEWHKNGKPADRPKKRAARTKPRTTGTNAARIVGDLAEHVNAGSARPSGPARHRIRWNTLTIVSWQTASSYARFH